MNIIKVDNTNRKFHLLTVRMSRLELKIFNSGKYKFRIFKDLNFNLNSESEELVSTIANYFNYSIDELSMKSRTRKTVIPRMFICVFLREFTNISLAKIGEIIDRDHASVMHMIKRYKSEIYYKDIQEHRQNLDFILEKFNIIKEKV